MIRHQGDKVPSVDLGGEDYLAEEDEDQTTVTRRKRSERGYNCTRPLFRETVDPQ